MKVVRQSNLSRIIHCRDVPIADRSALDYYDRNKGRLTVRQAFPYLASEDLLYIATGITPEEWRHAFGETPNPYVHKK
jgi:hypothetical protein